MKQNKGFTLIEMLVVVGMIGVLAAAVLTALGPSRAKARDTRIISGLNQIAALAETQFDGNNYPASTAFASSTVSDVLGFNNNKALTWATASGAFLIASPLASDATKYYCVDSTGNRKTLGAAPAGTTCQ